jgi:hypothetical protein
LEEFGSNMDFGWDCLRRWFPFRFDEEFVGWEFVAGKKDYKV